MFHSDNWRELVFESVTVGIAYTDACGVILDANQSLCQMFSSKAETLQGSDFIKMVAPEYLEYVCNCFQDFIDNTKQTIEKVEIYLKRPNGTCFWVNLSMKKLISNQTKYHSKYHFNILLMFEDISAYKEREIELERLANLDALTGLSNRRNLMTQFSNRFALQENNFAVVMLDLNHFKQINDTHGHKAGDVVLCKIAQRLESFVQPNELAARLSGDEFVLILDETITGYSECQLDHRINKLRALVKEDIYVEGKHLSVSASIGFVYSAEAPQNLSSLLSMADMTMYREKRQTHNGYPSRTIYSVA